MSHTRLRPSFSFTDEKLAELKRIAPEAFADGRVNWEALRAALGEHLEDDDANAEHFGLNWPGKREARKMAGTPSKGALVPQPGKGVNEDSTRNVFIEGENLEVLKLLQKAYAGKVKMIYIDPPYNTGKDFVYEDDFTEPLEEYLRRTGQVDEEGKALTTNTRADGRFHSKWLTMMYPRLRLARRLLKEDGFMFVSIDDNEVHHLRILLNEVFGEECFMVQATVQAPSYVETTDAVKMTEYIIGFKKEAQFALFGAIQKTESRGTVGNPDQTMPVVEFPAGLRVMDLADGTYKKARQLDSNEDIELLSDKFVVKDGVLAESVKLKARWRNPNDMKAFFANNCQPIINKFKKKVIEVYFKGDRLMPYTVKESGEKFPSLMTSDVIPGVNSKGSGAANDLLGFEAFDYPKNITLMKYLLSFTGPDDLVVDFFAGSGSTAHALDELNQEDGGNRSFVLVQLPELLDEKHEGRKRKFDTIADITRERIRRAFKQNKSEAGFLSFGLGKSHFRAWNDVEGADLTALEKAFAEAESPLVKDWTWEGLRTEVMLLEGFPLDSRVEPVKELNPGSKAGAGKNRVERIHHEWHAHRLLVCLDKKVAPETIKDLQLEDGDIFICLDTAIDDQSKLRLSDKGMIKTI